MWYALRYKGLQFLEFMHFQDYFLACKERDFPHKRHLFFPSWKWNESLENLP